MSESGQQPDPIALAAAAFWDKYVNGTYSKTDKRIWTHGFILGWHAHSNRRQSDGQWIEEWMTQMAKSARGYRA